MEKNTSINYEDYIGREVKGFKFKESEKLGYNSVMDYYIGKVGHISEYYKENNIFTVQFDNEWWLYPADLVIKQLEQKEDLVEMMEKDEEDGLYDDDSDKVKTKIGNETFEYKEVKPKQYSKGIDTFYRMESNCTKEECLAFAKGNIDKYNWRNKGQDLEDFDKIISYAKWAKRILNKDDWNIQDNKS